ncbi:unnamed protein product [Ectocarpus sp. 12 AP-2014]
MAAAAVLPNSSSRSSKTRLFVFLLTGSITTVHFVLTFFLAGSVQPFFGFASSWW